MSTEPTPPMDGPWQQDLGATIVGPIDRQGASASVWQLSNGDFLLIGRDMTNEYDGSLPSDASRAGHESIVLLDPSVMPALQAHFHSTTDHDEGSRS